MKLGMLVAADSGKLPLNAQDQVAWAFGVRVELVDGAASVPLMSDGVCALPVKGQRGGGD